MRPVQKFTSEYLEYCKQLSTEEIVEFLDNFKALHGEQKPGKSKLISMKVPENLLDAFKTKSRLEGTPYQTQIKKLMKDWLG